MPSPRLTRTGRSVATTVLAVALLGGGVACASGGTPSHRQALLHDGAKDTVHDPAPAAAAGSYPDWPTYHGDAARTGTASGMPGFTGHLGVTHRIALDGSVVGSPIVVGGRIIVATENDTVYAYTTDGRQLWKRHLGSPAQQNQLPCGNVFPLGITGTPVAAHGLVYVAPEYGAPLRHELVALRVGTGSVAWHRGLDFSGVDRAAMQERGALTITGGKVWVPFGGLLGDCGDYKGRLIGIALDGTGVHAQYTLPTDREAGIWTPPGPTVDRYGQLYVAVGNGAGRNGGYDHSDSVLKLTGDGGLRGSFSPSSWRTDNDRDADLGSQGPAIVQNTWIFQAGKSGTGYVLRRARLGGIGGQVSSAPLCRSFAGTAVQGADVYVPCTDGVRKVTITSTGHLVVRWHAAASGSPVIGARRIWVVAGRDNGMLYALRKQTGQQQAAVAVGAVGHFPTPALYGPYIVVPTLSGFTIVKES